MHVFFYRGELTNFGDELNLWLWPRLLDGAFDGEGDLFFGIGSNIREGFPAKRRKVVLGAGYGGYSPLPAMDGSWTFYFVRGKLTARALGLNDDLGIGDAGIYIRSCGVPRQRIPGKVAFIPHWESIWRGSWQEVCALAGLHFVDPTGPVDAVLADIASADYVITEAMHGAIIADALRVPWIPIRPVHHTHHMKWHDWASALGMDFDWERIPGSSLLEMALRHAPSGGRMSRALSRQRRATALLRDSTPRWVIQRAADHLDTLASMTAPRLSGDSAIESVHSRMLDQLQRFTQQEGVGRVLV
ncbi:MAG: polysaccharide pyruvyl transferase family protein [Burkholderiaceae bacterium]|nr:polysaccharide pyruvyl transferase family protein [Burkholderiaceae bacterium]